MHTIARHLIVIAALAYAGALSAQTFKIARGDSLGQVLQSYGKPDVRHTTYSDTARLCKQGERSDFLLYKRGALSTEIELCNSRVVTVSQRDNNL